MNDIKYRSVKKSRNEIVEILAKLKSWNLDQLIFRNLFKSKNSIKVRNASITEELNFYISNNRVVFTK